jgi:hypothetical protein
MEKTFKIILIAILAILIIQFMISFFTVSPGLRSSLRKLEASQKHLDSAILGARDAKARLDSIQTHLSKFSNYLITIQGQTEVLYKERELKDAKFKAQKDSILSIMAKLKIKVDSISLPELTVYDTRQPNQ